MNHLDSEGCHHCLSREACARALAKVRILCLKHVPSCQMGAIWSHIAIGR
jgi:hypothetical protein